MRVKIEAGAHKVGDTLEGRVITGLGKVWFEGQPQGQLWQPCWCGTEPVCLCEKCDRHCTCNQKSVQYAYFDEAK